MAMDRTKRSSTDKGHTVQKKKAILVFKRKRARPSTSTLPRLAVNTSNGGVVQRRSASELARELERELICKQNDQKKQSDGAEHYFQEDSLALDEASGTPFNDTFMLMQSLQATKSADKCLAIPLSAKSSNQNILGVLECVLYDGGLVHSSVSRDIRDLLQHNHIRMLSPPQSNATNSSLEAESASDIPPPSIFILASDFQKACQDAHVNCSTQNHSSVPPEQRDFVIQWFLDNLARWVSKRIVQSQIEAAWTEQEPPKDPNAAPASLDDALKYLVEIKVLLPNYGEGSYQLWLPSWPLVLKTWVKKTTAIMVQIKRSIYKERSLSSLEKMQKRSPIPVKLMVDYLVSIRYVSIVKKPSGDFVKLVTL